MTTSSSSSLALEEVTAGYARTTVLRDVSLSVGEESVVALLGPNGAGKTTLLRTAAGLLRPSHGTISVAGQDVTSMAPHRRARRGLCLIPEGRGVFGALTVKDNLRLQVPPWSKDAHAVDRALEAFPELKSRMGQLAGTMSGGEQQMLALCRAWTAAPKVVLLDEVSIGLAPRIVDKLFAALRALAADGASLLLVEQYVNRALEVADHVYLLEKGRIAFSGRPSELDEDTLFSRYVGLAAN